MESTKLRPTKQKLIPGQFVLNPNKLLNESKKRKKSEKHVKPLIDVKLKKMDDVKSKINKNKLEVSKIETKDLDRLDEVIIGIQKKKYDQRNKQEEKMLFGETPKNKLTKKDKLKLILKTDTMRTPIRSSGTNLRDRMKQKLKAAQFRYLNEILYTKSGEDAKQLFEENPTNFQTYHDGYRQQLEKWPVKPLDIIIKRLKSLPQTYQVADMGCGEALLAEKISQPVRSFDLVAVKDNIEKCDISHTPLLKSSTDVCVYCLSLMGTNLTSHIVEANRVLKLGGLLLIAEVESRFNDLEAFNISIQRLGFKLVNLDKTHQVFYFFEFKKTQDISTKKTNLPQILLKPCLYKKR